MMYNYFIYLYSMLNQKKNRIKIKKKKKMKEKYYLNKEHNIENLKRKQD